MVREDMLDMAVHWANQALNLNVINVGAPKIGAFHDENSQVDVLQASPAERRLLAAQSTGVYMMPVHGVLVSRSAHLDMCQTMTSYEEIREMLRAAVNDPAVAHIVMDIDTPGGSSTGCFELCDEIRAAREIKPITAISNFGAYSAGYAIASSASQIIVSQSSGVGSIGVIARHLDMSKRHEQQGVKITSVYAGARKNDLSSEAPMSDEALQWLTGLVNRQYDAFTQLVSTNRGWTFLPSGQPRLVCILARKLWLLASLIELKRPRQQWIVLPLRLRHVEPIRGHEELPLRQQP